MTTCIQLRLSQSWWQFWNLCTPEEKGCSDIILNMSIYTDCKITTLSNSITFFLVVRKKNWYHRCTRGEFSPFPPQWCLLFLPSFSFFSFAYDCSIFSTYFVHFLDFCMSQTYGLKSCCSTEAILPDLWKCFSRSCLYYRPLEPCPFKEIFVCLFGNKEGIWLESD